ncbi:MAG: hypothetical protein VX278_02190 [Myxococcota bacterium]|nr:hypothetical protein [Myxococcota bacterium]
MIKKAVLRIQNATCNNLQVKEFCIQMGTINLIQGPSGSGKSSFAIDTLLREGQRRLLSALHSNTVILPPTEAEFPDGLPTTLGIKQDENLQLGSYETLGTYSDIHANVAQLFNREACNYCPETNTPLPIHSPQEATREILRCLTDQRIAILSPIELENPSLYKQTLRELVLQGFARIRVGERIRNIEDAPPYPPKKWELVLDRIKVAVKNRDRIYSAIKQAYRISNGRVAIVNYDTTDPIRWFMSKPYSNAMAEYLQPPNQNLFQYRSAMGACVACKGKGTKDNEVCKACMGTRLKPELQYIRLNNENFMNVMNMNAKELLQYAKKLDGHIGIQTLIRQLELLCALGLHAIPMSRAFDVLSSGERSRLRLFRILLIELKGALFVLDEPTLGLSEHDLIAVKQQLVRLKEKGNTILIVDHNHLLEEIADRVYYFGPSAGQDGGQLLENPPKKETIPDFSALKDQTLLELQRFQTYGYRKPRSISIKKGGFNLICGPSGIGKTATLREIFALHKSDPRFSQFDSALLLEQRISGRSPRSCVATLCGAWSPIRMLLSQTKPARQEGYSPSHFSFNVSGGRCEACKGLGFIRVVTPPLTPYEVECSLCLGERFDSKTLSITYQNMNVSDILKLEVGAACRHFAHHPKLFPILRTMSDVGLDYIQLGQLSSTLSGGEIRRISLARELAQSLLKSESLERRLILIDEPSAALHHNDSLKLIGIFEKLRFKRATLLCASNHKLFREKADNNIALEAVE